MERVAANSLRCPICLDLPENHVYQCRNGHAICLQCSESLRHCPQCRVAYETVKIRNRAMEEILDNMELECPYKTEGCVKIILKKELSHHRHFCEFKPVEFCKLIGLTECKFSSRDGLTIFNHLRGTHNFSFFQSRNISLLKLPPEETAIIAPLGFLTPNIGLGESTDNFCVCQRQTFEQGQRNAVSLVAIYFGKRDDSMWNIQYDVQDEKGNSRFMWKLSPICFNNKNVKNYITNPPFPIPNIYLEEMQPRKDPSILADVIVEIHFSKSDQNPTMPEHEATSNEEMVEQLKLGGIIKSDTVVQIMLAVDRGLFISDKSKAYKNAEWKEGSIHLSSPAIYATVLEALELHPGLKFLNIGSGSGYLSTMVGMALGGNGVSFGIDCNYEAVCFAEKAQEEFKEIYNPQHFPNGVFWNTNIYKGLSIMNHIFDRVYCGSECPKEDVPMLHKFLKDGGICIAPVDGNLLKIRRASNNNFEATVLMSAIFEPLIKPCTQ